MKKTYKPGEKAKISGQYRLLNLSGKSMKIEVTVVAGKILPPTPKPKMKYRLIDITKHR